MHEEWRRSWPAFAPFIAVDFACTSPPLMPLDAHSFKMRRTPKKNPPENESIFFVFPQPKIIFRDFLHSFRASDFASHLHHFSEGSRHDYMITGRHIVWKLPKMSHLSFWILAFSANICNMTTWLLLLIFCSTVTFRFFGAKLLKTWPKYLPAKSSIWAFMR